MNKKHVKIQRRFSGYGASCLLAGSAFAMAISLSSTNAQAQALSDSTTSEDGPSVAEIVVTAQKTSDRLQDVPLSITAATSHTLKASVIQHLEAPNTLGTGPLNNGKKS